MTNYNMKGATIIWCYLCETMPTGTWVNAIDRLCGYRLRFSHAAVPFSGESKFGGSSVEDATLGVI